MIVADVLSTLEEITYVPSCVDMGWGWQAEATFSCTGEHGGACGDDYEPSGFRIRTTFRRPDRETGEIGTGYGRWWTLPLDVDVSGVVKTAFAASKLILEHELMESFKYAGARVFDPHNGVEALAQLSRRS